MNTAIRQLHARQILDSRGTPTVEVDCILADGSLGRAAVPSGASTGSHEAVELRDNDELHFFGKGVLTAVSNVNNLIAGEIVGMDARGQREVDSAMIALDGTSNKSRIGANAMLGVSLAVARAAAVSSRLPLFRYIGGMQALRLPVPMMNIINGGVHAGWEGSDFQEYMVVPYGARSVCQAVEWGAEIYHALKSVIKNKSYSTAVGDEGGFAPQAGSNRAPLDFIMQSVREVGLEPGNDVGIAMDPASSEFFRHDRYVLGTENRELTSEEMVDYYVTLVSDYPVIVLEDGLSEDDWDGWRMLNVNLGDRIELVGDDLFVTSVERIAIGIKNKAANGVLIKPNQAGTLSETVDAVKLAHKKGWGAMVSHRSGETTDSFIADLAVGLDVGHLKTGAPARGERVEKYNQLMRIEESLGKSAVFAGKEGFAVPVGF